mmetsp:Transcript_1828/g.7163  ORF Transcript_1828/g.7163 Transcript_1828/m.7163 type:complete len:213 (-) Transcript_1828:139-777(-)
MRIATASRRAPLRAVPRRQPLLSCHLILTGMFICSGSLLGAVVLPECMTGDVLQDALLCAAWALLVVVVPLFLFIRARCAEVRRRRELFAEVLLGHPGIDASRREAMRVLWRPEEGAAPTAGQQSETRPAAEGIVRSLPTHVVTAEELANASADLKACTICIEEFRRGEEQRTLPCFHRFHVECIDRWLRLNGQCPICKHRADTDLAPASFE